MKAYFNTRVLAVLVVATLFGTLGASVVHGYEQCRANGHSSMTCNK
ncbi:hypothetical protein HOV30_gp068 [Erwinia phage Derbicus]|uniref:Uncharacterized protein n=2 Tax=Derbicusvirus derbicus TaxID=2734104 RepID=A0A482IKT4_9CAUD|nr:hypothetical protein BIZ82_gp068 [Erwinia phage vB_EamM_EarlPhillipIV]YP_009821112.1 hypothetical protein HOV30_gp068 [Erwinia phage Derbicus]ANZ48918.1 hypothetical protein EARLPHILLIPIV_68 [Erwinia phage vB_EamM_EarlPhillipIV]QBP07494.1 hypothetical protein DERBICUS_68 [Erwinia phage Derbicus]